MDNVLMIHQSLAAYSHNKTFLGHPVGKLETGFHLVSAAVDYLGQLVHKIGALVSEIIGHIAHYLVIIDLKVQVLYLIRQGIDFGYLGIDHIVQVFLKVVKMGSCAVKVFCHHDSLFLHSIPDAGA